MQCEHTKPNGEPCQAHALPGKRCCTFHEPALKQKRAEGRKRGGVNRSRPAVTLSPETPDAPVSTVDDVINGQLPQHSERFSASTFRTVEGYCS
jgi:hypothetical protein